MRPILVLAAAISGLLIAGLAAEPAAAQQQKRVYARNGNTVIVTEDESGRRRTRIIVQRRSYLDGGTEVLPGEKHYSDYANPPYHNPFSALGRGNDYSDQPLPNSMGIYSVGPASVFW